MGRRRIVLSSIEETIAFGKRLASSLNPNDILALEGDLGSGKTHLVKGIALGLGFLSETEVQSPTFIYLSCYPTRIPLYHFDLYRLKTEGEFLSAGFDEYFYKGGVAVIEWPSRISSLLPPETKLLTLSYGEESHCRVIEFSL